MNRIITIGFGTDSMVVTMGYGDTVSPTPVIGDRILFLFSPIGLSIRLVSGIRRTLNLVSAI